MKIHVRKENTFIPTWEGNDKLPKEEQIVFHHRYLKTGERREYIYLEDATMKDISEGEVMNRKMVQNAQGITKAIVTKIDNLILVTDGKEQKIETIEAFYETPDAFPGLLAEVEANMLNATAAVDSKN